MRSQALIIALFVSTVPAFAQTTGEPARGNTPPGMSQDGSGPADGAIKGGSIRPGEERLQRCEQLHGKLREECLAGERGAAGGATIQKRPKEIDHLDLEKPGTK
jgi:hypothetical protein